MAKKYDDDAIKSLKSLEHIRLRPGMYVGRMGNGAHMDDGIYVLLKEIIDNGVDEYIMGHGKHIDIYIDENEVKIRDFGRGIPQGKLVECVSQINTGAKFNDDVFQFSVGLNGVGSKAVNALSSEFEVISYRDSKFKRALFRKGKLIEEKGGKSTEEDGTLVRFTPDNELFNKRYAFQDKFVKRRLWNYAYLNSGLVLNFNSEKFSSRRGLYDMLQEKIGEDKLYDIVHHKDTMLEFSFCHIAEFGENFFSYVNGQYTSDGGTHQSAFREGILKAVNAYSNKNYDGNDVRNGMFGAISIKLKEPIFESQTKNKLGNVEVRTDIVKKVHKIVELYMHQNKKIAEVIIEKTEQNAAVRKQIQNVRKASKDKAKKLALKIPKLKDCKFHFNDKDERGIGSMIFLAEGDSAVGPMVSSRDVNTQAIFPLKGKPLNCFGKKRDLVISNDEFYCIMRALNIEDGIENLRYNKVILATDADDDGMHIRNLLLTFFLYYFKELILKDHLFILETPLYRVRNKKKTIYCYEDSERDQAMEEIGRGAEIIRFKGLGEIDPKEFGQFIGDDMRLIPVEIERIHEIPELLSFFMGSNTPERRDYIMANLLQEV